MIEITICEELITAENPEPFPHLTKIELQALVYVIETITRAWLLQEGTNGDC
jgi:hypothetical protein